MPETKEKTKEKNKVAPFAVIETGGKQYKVSEGDVISIEKLEGEHSEGDKVVFDTVLLVDDGASVNVGEPYVKGSKVTAEFLEEGRGKKVSVTKFRSKSRYFRRKGHRQPYNKLKIVSIK
ncbi:MAG: 50S ribosomal protein L21 [Candidatus Paceibacterota bacterium]